MPKDSLPTIGDDPLAGRGYDALKGIEETILSGVDEVDHNGRNSWFRLYLSLQLRPAKVKRKMDINSAFISACAEN